MSGIHGFRESASVVQTYTGPSYYAGKRAVRMKGGILSMVSLWLTLPSYNCSSH